MYESHFEKATEYGRLVVKLTNGYLTYVTDQEYALQSEILSVKLTEYKEIWLDGVLLYKRPWWGIFFLSVSISYAYEGVDSFTYSVKVTTT